MTIKPRDSAIDLRRGNVALRISAKHIFYAPEICEHFGSLSSALPAETRQGLKIVDFSRQPDVLNLARMCVPFGVWIEHKGETCWLHKDTRAMVLAARHLIYAVDMAQKFDLYFQPLVPTQRDGVTILDFSRPGILQTYAASGLQFELASFPEEEEAIEEYFRWYRPRPGDLVFDIGAHCGVSTYHLAKLVGPEGRVVAFEPDPENFAILQRNLKRHRLENVTAENIAIAGQSGRLAFNAEGTIGSSLSSLLLRESVGSTVQVDAITLADAFSRWGRPAFCKVDIEGAEVETFRAAEALLHQGGTHFAVDTNHPRADGSMTDRAVEEIFLRSGYETASEAKPLLTTWARPKGSALQTVELDQSIPL